MRTAGLWLQRQVAVCLMFLLATPFGVAATTPQQAAEQAPRTTAAQASPQTATRPSEELPADAAQPPALPDSPNPAGSPAVESAATQSSAAPQQAGSSQSTPQQQNPPPQPLGTAAAPYQPGTGVAASRPSGAAIAPARQKRTRSFIIKVGLLIAAGVAVGTVVALSSASPSRASTQ